MEKIIQFGEGNFLRAFAEEYIQELGEKVAVCQPRKNDKIINKLKAQNCKYDIIKRGRLNGKVINERVHITCVSRAIDSVTEQKKVEELFCSNDLEYVISNTTEAGITFCDEDKEGDYTNISFPGKITYLLNKRQKSNCKPLIFLPAELIENNGPQLKRCVLCYGELWGYGKDFSNYVEKNHFCSTLVDRIVTGHIDGDENPCSVACEPYRNLVIEADEYAENKLPKWDTITYTNSLQRYRERKVKILNGGHTSTVLAALMDRHDIVRDTVQDEVYGKFMSQCFGEIRQTIDMDENELTDFINAVKERFDNPYIDHKLSDISLNSVAKFKARVLPSILEYKKVKGEYPKRLMFSLAALIAFYSHCGTSRNYTVRDDEKVTDFFTNKNNIVERALANTEFWGTDLSTDKIFVSEISDMYNGISEHGIRKAIETIINE